MSRLMAFVDGENLTARFEDMLRTGREERKSSHAYKTIGAVAYQQARFVWSQSTVNGFQNSEALQRVHYYTTFSGGNEELEAIHEQISSLRAFQFVDGAIDRPSNAITLISRVFHKTARKTKTKSVDINLCVDVLEYVRQDALDSVFLVTGDVDYLPLIEAVMKAGKTVYVAALSAGLSRRLKYCADKFIPLDDLYFE
jgi:uncharacterized LabA/DUF88 family protein